MSPVFNDVKSMKEYYVYFDGSYHIYKKGKRVIRNLKMHEAYEKCRELNLNIGK